MPYEKQSAAQGLFKVEQIRAMPGRCGGGRLRQLPRPACQKRLPRFFPGQGRYQVKYLWQLVAETLVPVPWSAEEIARGRELGRRQHQHFQAELDGGF